jgi:predicted secreted protein
MEHPIMPEIYHRIYIYIYTHIYIHFVYICIQNEHFVHLVHFVDFVHFVYFVHFVAIYFTLRFQVLFSKIKLTHSLLISHVSGAPNNARNLSSYIYTYIYGRQFYWGFYFFKHAFLYYMCEKPTNTPIIYSVY